MPEASPRGTYLIIAQALRKEIKEGVISEKLPSEAELMQAHGVSRNTIRRALRALEADGLVASSPGIGWRVGSNRDHRSLFDRLMDVITEDGLTIGDAYPSEAKLCERLSASRTAVRRALGQMEGNGLLSTIHGKGRTVRSLPAAPKQP